MVNPALLIFSIGLYKSLDCFYLGPFLPGPFHLNPSFTVLSTSLVTYFLLYNIPVYRYDGMTVFISTVYYRQIFLIPCNTRTRQIPDVLWYNFGRRTCDREIASSTPGLCIAV